MKWPLLLTVALVATVHFPVLIDGARLALMLPDLLRRKMLAADCREALRAFAA